ncbi:MAG TPA: hypothetical protein VK005_01800 [Acholeplasma sp.]|nr:hypothetical protein [Acholeplasma sp.]
MKKIILVLTMVFTLLLVACEQQDFVNPLPELDNSDELELTLTQKYDFLKDVDFNGVNYDEILLEQFAKFELNYELDTNVEYPPYKNKSHLETNIYFDYDAKSYIKLGDNVSETIIYLLLDKLEVKANYLTDSETTIDTTITNHQAIDLDIDFSDTYLLMKNQNIYAQTNGFFKLVVDLQGEINTTEKVFDMVKEKPTTENVFTQNEYQILKDLFDSFMAYDFTLPEELPTDSSYDELLSEFDQMIKVYQQGDLYTVRVLIDKAMVDELIDQQFDSIILGYQIEYSEEEKQQIEEAKTILKAALQAFEFDFRFEVRNNKVKRILGSLTGQIGPTEYSIPDLEEGNYGIYKGMIKLEKFGFIIDLDPVAPSMPTNFNGFAQVDQLAFVKFVNSIDLY